MKSKKTFIIFILAMVVFGIMATVRILVPNEYIYDNPDNPTLLGRVVEFLTVHKAGIVSILNGALVALATAYIRVKTDGIAKKIEDDTSSLKNDTSSTLLGQNAVTNVINELIDASNLMGKRYDAMSKDYQEYGSLENDRNLMSGAVLTTNLAILKMLATVYANSKNLPQGVKDLVTMDYAKCLAVLDDDASVSELIKLVKKNIGGEEITEPAASENSEAVIEG